MRLNIPELNVGNKIDRVVFSSLLLVDWLTCFVAIGYAWWYPFSNQDPTLTDAFNKTLVAVILTPIMFIIHSIVSGIIWWIFMRLYALAATLFAVITDRITV